MLEAQELSNILLWIPRLDSGENIFMQCKLGELTRSKEIGGGDDRWNDDRRLVGSERLFAVSLLLRTLFANVGHDVISRRSIAGITGNVDATALRGTDGKATDAILVLKLLQLALLFSPLGTALAFGALVWFGQ